MRPLIKINTANWPCTCNIKYMLRWMRFNKLFVYSMRISSRKTAKPTCGSRLGSVCGSRIEAMLKYLDLTCSHNSQK